MLTEEIESRWYQDDCVSAACDVILNKPKNNPIAVVPTGAGKSVILCKIIDEYLTANPHKDVLVLSHVFKILEQNYDKISGYLGDAFLGLYSASLGSRTKSKITVGGIQSVWKKADLFQNVGLVIIDECHLINSKKDVGRYRKFLSQLNCVCMGLTATPFRTGQGYIYKKYADFDPIFNKVCYDLSSYENYNKLVDQGYLSPLIPAPTSMTFEREGLSVKGGEFVDAELSDRFDREEITKSCINNIIKYAKDKYKKWLIFAIDIEHAEHIKMELLGKGISSTCIHSKMDLDPRKELRKFECGEYKAAINVDMLTTGMDIPSIDLIAHLRPSQSPVYHVQSNGRGGRVAPGKSHCLVLDFAGNTQTHGPINDVIVNEPDKPKKKNVGPVTKSCPNCGTQNATRAKFCIACDEEFKFEQKITPKASQLDLLKESEEKGQWVKVNDVEYSIHQKQGSPNSLRVEYFCGFNVYNEFVCIGHSGFPKAKANKWIRRRFIGGFIPTDLKELYENVHLIKRPSEIFVIKKGKYFEIQDHKFGKGDNLPPKPRKNKFGIAPSRYTESPIFEDDVPF